MAMMVRIPSRVLWRTARFSTAQRRRPYTTESNGKSQFWEENLWEDGTRSLLKGVKGKNTFTRQDRVGLHR